MVGLEEREVTGASDGTLNDRRSPSCLILSKGSRELSTPYSMPVSTPYREPSKQEIPTICRFRGVWGLSSQTEN